MVVNKCCHIRKARLASKHTGVTLMSDSVILEKIDSLRTQLQV